LAGARRHFVEIAGYVRLNINLHPVLVAIFGEAAVIIIRHDLGLRLAHVFSVFGPENVPGEAVCAKSLRNSRISVAVGAERRNSETVNQRVLRIKVVRVWLPERDAGTKWLENFLGSPRAAKGNTIQTGESEDG
jgi:hypothetical protein